MGLQTAVSQDVRDCDGPINEMSGNQNSTMARKRVFLCAHESNAFDPGPFDHTIQPG